jgi:hypothetical protein
VLEHVLGEGPLLPAATDAHVLPVRVQDVEV